MSALLFSNIMFYCLNFDCYIDIKLIHFEVGGLHFNMDRLDEGLFSNIQTINNGLKIWLITTSTLE